MDVWSNCVITNKGLALQAKLIAGTKLTITKAVTGTGYVDPSTLRTQTSVTGVKQTLSFRRVSYPSDGRCSLPCRLSNSGLSAGYTASQVGVYANDPDDGEILYFIAQADSGGGTDIPSESESPGYIAEWTFHFQYGQADGVEMTVSPADTVTVSMLEDELNTVNSNIETMGLVKANNTLSNVSGEDFLTKALSSGATTLIAVTSGTGSDYTATVQGIDELYTGLTITIIPHVTSTTISPTFNLNGTGAKNLRQRISLTTGTVVTGSTTTWIQKDKPISIIYDGSIWIANLTVQSADYLYGTVPVEKGGTGAIDADGALENLGINSLIKNLPNLYVWSKWEGNPSSFLTSPVTNVTIADNLISFDGFGKTIYYSVEIACVDSVISLVDPQNTRLVTESDATVLKGKFVLAENNTIYLVSQDAVFTQESGSVSGRIKIIASSATKYYPVYNRIGYVSSFNRDSYPTNGMSGSYWYTYKKQLGD